MVRIPYVPALDGIRGIAILLVLAWHMPYQLPAGGWLGVDLFFVLSGFLITTLLLSEWNAGGAVSLRAFYRRRAARLFPALGLMLSACLLALAIAEPTRLGQATEGALLGVAYVMNLVLGLAGDVPEPAFGHLWSLAQEEQFYLVWPLALLVALRRSLPPAIMLTGLVVCVLAVWVRIETLEGTNVADARLWALPDVRADSILIGCVAGVAYSYGIVRRIPSVVAWTSALIASIIVASSGGPHQQPFGSPFAVAAAVVVLACVLSETSRLSRTLSNRPLRYLGRISYGVYLWHLPLYLAFGWKRGLVLTLLISSVSYRYFELPIIRRARSRPQKATLDEFVPEPATERDVGQDATAHDPDRPRLPVRGRFRHVLSSPRVPQ